MKRGGRLLKNNNSGVGVLTWVFNGLVIYSTKAYARVWSKRYTQKLPFISK